MALGIAMNGLLQKKKITEWEWVLNCTYSDVHWGLHTEGHNKWQRIICTIDGSELIDSIVVWHDLHTKNLLQACDIGTWA